MTIALFDQPWWTPSGSTPQLLIGQAVHVYQDNDGALTATPQALFTDEEGGTTSPNPFSVDAGGNVRFFADAEFAWVKVGAFPAVRVQVRSPQAPVDLAPVEAGVTSTRALTLQRYDDFTARPNGRLDLQPLLPSGESWVVGVAPPATAADLQILDGKLRLLAQGASYVRTGGSVPPDEIAAEFVRMPGSTNGTVVGLICSQKPPTNPATGATGIATNSVHGVVGPVSMVVGIFDGVTGLSNFLTIPFGSALVADGETRYRAVIRRIGVDRLLVIPPGNNAPVLVRDSRIPRYWGATVLIEHFTEAADPGMAFISYGTGQSESRGLPTDLPPGTLGIPGGFPCTVGGLFNIATGTTRYTPFEVREPITINAALLEVTTAAPTPGATARAAIYAVTSAMQPSALMADLGTVAIDSIGVKTWAPAPNVTLQPGRYLLALRGSDTAQYRIAAYGVPNFGIRSNLGPNYFVNVLSIAEAYGAYANPGTAWNVSNASPAIGWLCPIVLGWVPA